MSRRADDKEINQEEKKEEEQETPIVVTADWQTKRDTNNDHAMRGGEEGVRRGMGLQMLQEDCTIMVDIEGSSSGSIVGFAGRHNRDGVLVGLGVLYTARPSAGCVCRLFPPLQMQCR